MEMLKPLLNAFKGVPQMEKLLEKVTEFGGKMAKIGPFCFVKGTPVLTVKGLKPIEQIKPWDWVWSRSEDGARWGWRPVRGIITTHPDTLVHVRYAALSRNGGDGGPGDDGPSASESSAEQAGAVELVCTAEHPFHVQRVGYSGFLPLREVTSGDLLTLADGRAARVQDLVTEVAPAGELFTTYNFEVAEHHTYFAGELPVWVHNTGLSPCDKLTKKMLSIITKKGDDVSKYFNYLVEAREELAPPGVADLVGKLSHKFWAKSGKSINDKMMEAIRKGETTWDKIPTVADWNTKFFKRPPGFDYKVGSWKSALEQGMLTRRPDFDLHHIIPKHIMARLQKLGIKPGLDLDSTPGHLMKMADHQAMTKAMNEVLSPTKVAKMTADDLMKELRTFYNGYGEFAQEEIVRGFFNL